MDTRRGTPMEPTWLTRLNPWVSLVGRLIFGGYFLYSGITHFIGLEGLAGYAASKGVPLPSLAVAFSGLLLVLGGLSIVLGWWTRLGAWLIVFFLLPVSVMMHDYWAIADPQQAAGERLNFMKNMAMLGAALMIATVPRWPLSLGARSPER